ncbi:MAG: tetratricopeptide repeat protein [Planctomycetaceae bacterium]|nr:tetratricopeptide repeat protein [Planctomycetaceae bacterium]
MRALQAFSVGVIVVGLAGCGSGETKLPLMRVAGPSESALARVTELTANGDLKGALARADEVVEQNPNSPTAYEARGSVYHKQREWDRALADFDRAIALDPQSARLRNNRGFLRLSLEQFDAATEDFNESVKLSPEFVQAYNNRALVQIAQGKYRQAIDDLDKALTLKPDYLDAANNRGFSLMNLRRWDRALADFNRVLQIDRKHVNALANRALVKQHLGDFSGSITDLTDAMLLDPDKAKYYAHRRDAYLAQGDVERARQDDLKIQYLIQLDEATAAITAKPQDAASYVARAKLYRQRGDERRCLDDLAKAIELSPTRADARLQRARLLCDAKQFAAAIADCDAVLARGPNESAFSIRGDCRLAMEQVDEALADFEQARRLDSAVADAYFLKGKELARKGDAEQAQAYHDKAVAVDPDVETRLK